MQVDRGIDIAAKRDDIRKITLKHFSVPGVHPDDLVQEVLLGILQRNVQPRSAYDPRRASFGTYVYMVGRNVSARLARREQRQYRARVALAERLKLSPHVAGLNGWPIDRHEAADPLSMPRQGRKRRVSRKA